jgi:hypothetical protein
MKSWIQLADARLEALEPWGIGVGLRSKGKL